MGRRRGWSPEGVAGLIAVYVAIIGLLMVSNVLYHSGKEFNLKGRISFPKMIIVVLVAGFISTEPQLWLWLILLGYTVSGPILWLKRKLPNSLGVNRFVTRDLWMRAG